MSRPSSEPLSPLGALVVFGGFFGSIALIKASVWQQPPVWDTAMGVFPPAIHLYRSGFDLSALLELPGWVSGGPNVHTLSAVTWITSGCIALTGGGPAFFPLLHGLHFAITALTLTALFAFARPMLGTRLALATSVCVLLVPVFLTQAGYMYLEMPLAACTALALWAWSSGRFLQSVVWVALACWIKGTGLIVAGTLLVAVVLEPRPLWQRVSRAVALVALPVTLQAVRTLLSGDVDPWEAPGYLEYVVENFVRRLARIPDLLLISFTVLLGAGLRAGSVWRGLRVGPQHPGRPAGPDLAFQRLALCILVVCVFFAFFLLAPLSGKTPLVLSRYYVQIVPFLVLALVGLGALLLPRRVLLVGVALLMLFFVANRNGALYPHDVDSFSIVERSGGYVDFLDVQRQGIEEIARVDPAVPVFYGVAEHYMTSDPLMGYLDAPLPNGHAIGLEEPYRSGRLEDYPPHFFMLLSNSSHGGEIMASLLKQIWEDPRRTATVVREFEAGEFRTYLVEVATPDAG